MKRSRLEWIDIAKAIGIFLVVLAHTYRGVTAAGVSTFSYLELIDNVIYTFHMPLFFFISGIFFVNSIAKRSNSEFVVNKVETIVYPYLLWGTIQGLMIAYFSSKGIANQDIKYIEVVQFWKPVGQFWFLHNLFFIMLFTGLVFRLNLLKYKFALIAIATILYLFPELSKDFFFFSILSKSWIFFLLGLLSKDYLSSLDKINTNGFGFFVGCIIALQLYFHCILKMTYESRGVGTLILAFSSILIVIAAAKLLEGRVGKWVLLVGEQSMAIYLLHVFFASGARILLHKVIGINSLWIDLIIGTSLGMLLPLMIGCYVQNKNIHGIFSINLSKLRSKNA